MLMNNRSAISASVSPSASSDKISLSRRVSKVSFVAGVAIRLGGGRQQERVKHKCLQLQQRSQRWLSRPLQTTWASSRSLPAPIASTTLSRSSEADTTRMAGPVGLHAGDGGAPGAVRKMEIE